MDLFGGLTSSMKLLVTQLVLALFAVAAVLRVRVVPQPLPQPISMNGPVATDDVEVRMSQITVKWQVPVKHRLTAYRFAHAQMPGEKRLYADLPRLPDDRSPDSKTWDNSIAICACMLKENSTDVREWLMYHRWLGIDHIYLTENWDPPREGLFEQLRDFVDAGFLTLRSLAKPAYQQHIYLDCMRDHRHKYNWMAFIDLDEFIFYRKRGTELKEFLNGFKHEPALSMHWVMVGPSGHKKRPATGGVLRAYQMCAGHADRTVKSIVNNWYLLNTGGNPHNFEYRGPRSSVDEHHNELPWRYPLPKYCTNGTILEPQNEIHCRRIPNIRMDKPKSIDFIAVFHYATRSREDFEVKHARGGGGRSKRGWHFYKFLERTASKKGGICKAMARLADKCCPVKNYTLPAS